MMDNSNYKQTHIVFQTWKTLNSSIIYNWLSEDVIYESYWVLLPLIGKGSVFDHLTKKFETIRNGINSGKLTPEVHLIKSIDEELLVLIKHHNNGVWEPSVVRIIVELGLILRLSIIPVETIRDHIIIPTE